MLHEALSDGLKGRPRGLAKQVAARIVAGIRATQEGKPALLEFISGRDKIFST